MIQVDPPSYSSRDGSDRLQTSIRVRERVHDLWFCAPGPIATTIEPFFDLALPVAMKLRLPIRCGSPISNRLRSNVANLQAQLAGNDPSLVPVEVTFSGDAKSEPDCHAPIADRGIGVFFSGGVDSFHTLFANLDTITHLVFVHGFDIPIDNLQARDIALGSAREVAQTLNKKLIVVETNLRGYGDPLVNWGHHLFGAAAAAVCHLLSPQLASIFIAGEKLDANAQVGSRIDLDPLWATENASLIHHGDDRSRFRKLEGLAHHPLAQRHLRVCWSNVANMRNCGQCSKCMRNMAGLRALGVLDKFTAFERPLDLRAMACLPLPPDWKHVERGVREIMTYAQAHGRDPELVRALRDCVEQRYHGGWINQLRWHYWRLCHRLGRRSV